VCVSKLCVCEQVVCVSKLCVCVDKLCVNKLFVCVSKLCVDKLGVSKLRVDKLCVCVHCYSHAENNNWTSDDYARYVSEFMRHRPLNSRGLQGVS